MSLDWTDRSGRLDAGGQSLEWARWGPDPDRRTPVVVMLHEGLGCLALWRDFPERLVQVTGHPVFAYSRAGHGRSDLCDLPRPLDFMSREATVVLADVLDAIGGHPFILLGHSDGATIAAEYAGRVSDSRVRGIILMAPHFFTEDKGLAEIARTAASYDTTDLKDRMARYHTDPEVTFRAWSAVWLNPEFKTWNVARVIDCWRISALVIQGADDQYGTAAQVTEAETRSQAPVDVALLQNCRHSPHLDQPAQTLVAISKFVARLDRIEAAEVVIA